MALPAERVHPRIGLGSTATWAGTGWFVEDQDVQACQYSYSTVSVPRMPVSRWPGTVQ
jgi:hypothetical protein